MTTVDTDAPDAQVDEQNPPADADDESLSPPSVEEEATSPSAAEEYDQIKELRDRLAQSGRTIAELRTANTSLAGQIAATNERLNQLGETLTAEQKAKQEAYLASLPPEQREKEELRLTNQRLETRLSALEREKTAPRQPTLEEQQQATVRYAQQMLDEAAADFGLDTQGGERILVSDARLAGAWSSPEEFKRQARILARRISLGKEPAQIEGGSVAENKNKSKTAAPAAAPDVAKIAAEAAQKAVQEALGGIGGAPNSPRPAAMIPERTPDEQAFHTTLRGYSPSRGPKATKDELKRQLAAAESAAGKKGLL